MSTAKAPAAPSDRICEKQNNFASDSAHYAHTDVVFATPGGRKVALGKGVTRNICCVFDARENDKQANSHTRFPISDCRFGGFVNGPENFSR